MASRLWRRFMTSRFPMRGRAMARSGAAAVRTEEGAGRPETDGPSFFLLPKSRKDSSVKRAEPASPATRPATAARTVTGLLLPDPGNEKDGEDADALLHHLGKGRDLYLFFSVIPAA